MPQSDLEITSIIENPFLAQAVRYLDVFLRMMMILAGLSLATLMFAQVIMRYLLDSPFAGIEEVTILLGVWVYFLGMGYATKTREHINGGIVSLLISDPYKLHLLQLGRSIVCMIAAAVFGYFACKYALFVIEKGRMSIYLQWPKGFWSSSMIVGFAMMMGYFLVDAIKEYKTVMTYKNNKSLESQ